MNKFTLKEIANHINMDFIGDGNIEISSINNLEKATNNELSFLSNNRFKELLKTTKAGAVILTTSDARFYSGNIIISENPQLSFAYVAKMFDTTPKSAEGISNKATIFEDAKIGKNVSIGHNTVIESGVVIEDDVEIGANCFIGKNVKINKSTKLWSNISVYHNVQIGKNCLIQANAVIGSDGFGYANNKGKWIKIPQIGTVVIGDNVEIGSFTAIDRGALGDTIISDNVIIDNLCQIAHNVEIGYGTAIAGGVIMAGSLKVGKHCIIGGASVFNGHMQICDYVTISGMAMIMRPITIPGVYSSGVPAQTNKEWRKTAARALHIDDMYLKIQKLEKKITELQSHIDN